jgi:hypothetical protein
MWELDVIEKHLKSQMVGYDDPREVFETIKEGLEHWKSWLNDSALGRREKSILRNLKDEVQDRILKLE